MCSLPHFKSFSIVQVFGQDGSLFQFSSSSKHHIWKPVLVFQQPLKACTPETSSLTCPCTWSRWVRNSPSCCTANHEQPLMLPRAKPNLERRKKFGTKKIIWEHEDRAEKFVVFDPSWPSQDWERMQQISFC